MRRRAVRLFLCPAFAGYAQVTAFAAFAALLIRFGAGAGPGIPATLAALSIGCIAASAAIAAAAAGRRSAEASLRRVHEQLEAMKRSRSGCLSDAADELRREMAEHSRTAGRLRECEKHVSLLAGHTDDWLCAITGDLRLSYVTPSCMRITGYSSEEFMRDPSLLLSITHPEDRGAMADSLESPPGPGETRSFDYRIIHRNGEIVWLNHTCRSEATGGDAATGFCVYNRDVTGRKRVENLIRRIASCDADHLHTAAAGGAGMCSVPADCITAGKAPADSSAPESIRAELQLALERKEFLVFYQPLVCIESGQMTAVEALVRWRHPTRGILPPAAFMDQAEACGLIVPIGMGVLREACTELAGWDSLGMTPLRLCVNLSLRQFRDPSLAEEISHILQGTGIDPGRIELEISEQTAMTREPAVHDTMTRLISMGLHLSLDNYGSGSSSLNRLNRLQIESIKIDRAFIQASTKSEREAAAARSVINMARSLRLRVVAAGVEQPGQLEFLRREGCEDYQGFLFSPPIPGEEIERLLVAASSPSARPQRRNRSINRAGSPPLQPCPPP